VAVVRCGDAVQEVDARSSDAISLALCTGSPIYVAEEILEDAWEKQQLAADVPIRRGLDTQSEFDAKNATVEGTLSGCQIAPTSHRARDGKVTP